MTDAMMFETSPETDKLDAAMAKAQASVSAAIKDKNNPAFRSKYADLSAVWEACRSALTANGISVTQWPVHSTDGRLHLVTRVACAGQWMRAHFSIPVQKADAHGYGSGTTYAKRFALAAAVGVVADDDDDGNAASQPVKSSAAAKRDGEWEKITAEIDAIGTQAALKAWGATNRDRIRALPEKWQEQVTEYYTGRMGQLRQMDETQFAGAAQ